MDRTTISADVHCRFVASLLLAGMLNSALATNDPWARAPTIVESANAWQAGMPVPPELRRFRESPTDMPTPMDSLSLISEVKNLSLLAALAIDVSADPECREDAFTQGVYVGGPTKFFEVVERTLDTTDGERSEWVTELRGRMAGPHVVVDALFIDDADMSSEEAKNVLDRIEAQLTAGANWDAVYREFADEFGYRTSDRTKIGNLGRFVVFNDPALGRGHYVDAGPHTITWTGEELPRRLWRLSYFDASHLPTLIRSSMGAVVRLHSKQYHQYVLYQVREVYSGRK